MIKQMTIANGGDWSGIYINSKLIYEGHSIDPFDAASFVVEYNVECVVSRDVDTEWLEDRGDLPSNIDDVQWDEPFAAAPTQVGAA